MHRCWSISEVLKMIFEHLPPDTGFGRKALSRLARTCHRFTEPSLDSLWREQDSFTPLLRCFPAVWEESDDEPQFDFNLDTTVVPEHWARVLFYSNRIKRLLVEPHSAPTLEILQFFNMSVPADFLMPNLQHLLWDPDNDESFPFIRLFLGPNITSLDVTMSGNISRLALIPFIGRKYPQLAHLSVLTPHDYEVESNFLCQAFSHAIHSLSHLETLCLQDIDNETLSHVASLPALHSLTIVNFGSTQFPDGHVHQLHQVLFPALQILRLDQVYKLSAVQSFIGLLPSNAGLREFRVTSDSLATKDFVFVLLSSLRDHCSPNTLTEVTLEVAAQYTGWSQLYKFSGSTIRPLLSFPKLSNVKIEAPAGFLLDDDFVTAMATAWPFLTSLVLSRGTPRPDRPEPPLTPSILSLKSFASHCPHLALLRIPVNAKNIFPLAPDASHRRRRPQTALVELHVDDALIDKAGTATSVDVARFLSCAFPALRTIVTTPRRRVEGARDAKLERQRWQEVERVLPLLAAVRTEEERYWRQELASAMS